MVRPISAAAVGVGVVFSIGLPGWWPLAPGLVLLGVAWVSNTFDAGQDIALAATCWGAVAVAMAVLVDLVWPIPPAVGLCVAAVMWQTMGQNYRVRWLGSGVPDRPAEVLAMVSVPVTVMSLVVFISSGRTDIDTATEGLQGLPVWLVMLAGLGFVVVNPTVEEILFRGVLQTAFVSATGSVAFAVIAQGILFGAIHRNGVPGGSLGMVMAGIWGVALGVIRHRTESIRVPWIVHFVANMVIFAAVAFLGHSDGIL